MSATSFRTTGFAALRKQMDRLSAGIPEARIRAILHEAGELIAVEARRLAPVDTGALRDSIAVTDDLDARIYGKLNGPGISLYIGPVGSTEDGDVYYARFQEFGWAEHPGRPFMRPAIAAKRPAAEALVVKLLAAEVMGMAQ